LCDFRPRKAAEAVATEARGVHPAQCDSRDGAQQCRDCYEHGRHAVAEIRTIQPAALEHREVQVVFAHSLDRPPKGFMPGTEARVEIASVLLLQVMAYEGRVRHGYTLIFDVRQKSQGRAERIALHRTVLESGKFKEHHHLDHEGAGVGRTQEGSESI